MESFDLKCRQCGAPIDAKDIVVELAMARCAQCGAVNGIKDLPSWLRQAVPLPDGFLLETAGDGVVIRRAWRRLQDYALGVTGAAWMGFGGLFISTILRDAGAPGFMTGVTVLMAAPGALMCYAALAGILNETRVRVTRERLTVDSGPVPYARGASVASPEVVQAFTRERRVTGGRGELHSYEVVARLRDGTFLPLLSGLEEAPQALFIEQQIERTLGLRDVPVPGEIPRSGS